MIFYNRSILKDFYRHEEVLARANITPMKCSLCRDIDIHSTGVKFSCLLKSGIDYIDKKRFTYIPPQHTWCVEKYKLEKVVPTIE